MSVVPGSRFFHNETSNRLVSVEVRTKPTFAFDNPTALPIERTVHPVARRNYDIGPDGRLVVIVTPTGPESAARSVHQINVVLNWFEELKARVPVSK